MTPNMPRPAQEIGIFHERYDPGFRIQVDLGRISVALRHTSGRLE